MHYDDQARRSNVLAGLVLGALVGAGMSLLLPRNLRPRRAQRMQLPGTLRRGAGRFGR